MSNETNLIRLKLTTGTVINGKYVVDTELSEESDNAVANKAVTKGLNNAITGVAVKPDSTELTLTRGDGSTEVVKLVTKVEVTGVANGTYIRPDDPIAQIAK